MATLEQVFTCQEAAELLEVSDARIRQLCIEHREIGRKHGRSWLLTEADIERIRNLPDHRKKKPS